MLSVERATGPAAARLPPVQKLTDRLLTEGYVNEPAVIAPDLIARLRVGAERLFAHEIPPAFIFVYDEAWQVFHSLAPFLAHTLGEGYRMLPGLWAWFVPPANDATGWVPHRDRSAVTIGAGNHPFSLTVWLPLTDATPLNGCIYVLPAHLDPDLRRPEKCEFTFSGDTLQNVRALPATAGSLLAWNQSLLHWGARASNLGGQPRVSLALQFQRGELPAFEAPLLDPRTPLSFPDRIGLIGHLICVFSGFLTLPPAVRMLGTALDWKYWRRGP